MAGEKHVLVNFGGVYTSSELTPEIWQCGIRCAVVFGTVDPTGTLPNNWEVQPETQTSTTGNWDNTNVWSVDGPLTATFDPLSWMTDQIQPALETFFATDSFSSTTKLTFIKISPIGSNGKVIEGRTTLAEANTSITGGQTGDRLPPQLSVGTSWQTAVIGRRGRGRIFLPSNAASQLDSAGRLKSANASSNLSQAIAFLEAMAVTSSGPTASQAIPIVTGSPWTTYGIISGVRVGNVLDTQRRRRDQLAEAYVSGAVSY